MSEQRSQSGGLGSSAALSYDFPITSIDAERRLIDFEETGATGELGIAIQREIAVHAAAAPARIDRGTVTRDDAKAHHYLLEAIAADLHVRAQRAFLWSQWLVDHRLDVPPPLDQLLAEQAEKIEPRPWAAKVATLRTVIEARSRSFDDDVAKGRATHALARAQLDALEALHALYWCDGFAWDGTTDELREHSDRLSVRYGRAEAA